MMDGDVGMHIVLYLWLLGLLCRACFVWGRKRGKLDNE